MVVLEQILKTIYLPEDTAAWLAESAKAKSVAIAKVCCLRPSFRDPGVRLNLLIARVCRRNGKKQSRSQLQASAKQLCPSGMARPSMLSSHHLLANTDFGRRSRATKRRHSDASEGEAASASEASDVEMSSPKRRKAARGSGSDGEGDDGEEDGDGEGGGKEKLGRAARTKAKVRSGSLGSGCNADVYCFSVQARIRKQAKDTA
jgi:hypothetical protein